MEEKKKSSKLASFIEHALVSTVVATAVPTLTQYAKSKVLYTLDITHLRHDISKWLMVKFTSTKAMYLINDPHKKQIGDGNLVETGLLGGNGEVKDICLYNGILIHYQQTVKATNNGNGQNVSVFLSTINTPNCRKILHDFIKAGVRYDKKYQALQTPTLSNLDTRSWVGTIDLIDRTFDNVFIKDENETRLRDFLDAFKSREDWYKDNNIPYHAGILLYGEPGTGKSSIAQVIAKYLNAETFVMSGDNIYDIPTELTGRESHITIATDAGHLRCLIIEDVDCGFEASKDKVNTESDDRKQNKSNRKNGLASVLNCLDGIFAPENLVVVMTTNHIEKLDPALIRPGRIDCMLNIDYLDNETFMKFLKFHYGVDNVPAFKRGYKIKDKLTCAELQVEVMRGLTCDELIEFARKERTTKNANIKHKEKGTG